MRPDQALKHLLTSLPSHDIATKEEDIRCAFEENTRESVTDWVEQYLGNDTLLSNEEAELYYLVPTHYAIFAYYQAGIRYWKRMVSLAESQRLMIWTLSDLFSMKKLRPP